MLEAFRVKGFRSFIDSGEVELRPLTIFVGKNSSGKSSLLRVLPLIKQSIFEETREPILWFGDVDFGSFDLAKSRYTSHDGMYFEFRMGGLSRATEEVLISEFGQRYYLRPHSSSPLVLDESLDVRLGQALSNAHSQGVRTTDLICKVGEDRLAISVGGSGELTAIKFNDLSLDVPSQVSAQVDKRSFFPRFVDSSKASTSIAAARAMRDGPFFAALLKELEPLFHHKAKDEGRRQITRSLKFGAREAFSEHLFQVFSTTASKLGALCDQDVDKLRGLVLLRNLPEIVRRTSQQVDKFCSGVQYIEPVRARASRYYRYQELAVDEIASDGANVPMFLHSLTQQQRTQLENWLSDSLGFTVRAERSGDGHIQLLVREAGSAAEVNLADTGFGYSQILPVALQLWKSGQKLSGARPGEGGKQTTIAIEQPELHLHPQMQALLADVFSLSLLASKKASQSLRLVLETHSEHLINRLGELIEAGTLSKNDVAIYVFERDPDDGHSVARKVEFSDSGVLAKPWPIGFFVPKLPEKISWNTEAVTPHAD